MQIVDLKGIHSEVLRSVASRILKSGIVVCPTDTCYIFAGNGLDHEAIQKIFSLKKRSLLNPIHVAVSSMRAAKNYAYVNDAAKRLARSFLPGPLTLVLRRRETIPSVLVSGSETVGIRIPNDAIVLSLARLTKCPLTATSANISGMPTPYSVKEVIEQVGDQIEQIDMILDGGPLPALGTSTVVDLAGSFPRILREGRIGRQEIMRALGGREDEMA